MNSSRIPKLLVFSSQSSSSLRSYWVFWVWNLLSAFHFSWTYSSSSTFLLNFMSLWKLIGRQVSNLTYPNGEFPFSSTSISWYIPSVWQIMAGASNKALTRAGRALLGNVTTVSAVGTYATTFMGCFFEIDVGVPCFCVHVCSSLFVEPSSSDSHSTLNLCAADWSFSMLLFPEMSENLYLLAGGVGCGRLVKTARCMSMFWLILKKRKIKNCFDWFFVLLSREWCDNIALWHQCSVWGWLILQLCEDGESASCRSPHCRLCRSDGSGRSPGTWNSVSIWVHYELWWKLLVRPAAHTQALPLKAFSNIQKQLRESRFPPCHFFKFLGLVAVECGRSGCSVIACLICWTPIIHRCRQWTFLWRTW